MGQSSHSKSIIYALVLATGMSFLFPEGAFSASRSSRRSGKFSASAVRSAHRFEGIRLSFGRVQGATSFQRFFRSLPFSVPGRWCGWVHWRAHHRRWRCHHHPATLLSAPTVLSAHPIERTCPNRNIRVPTVGGWRSRRGDLEARVLEQREAIGTALATIGKQSPAPSHFHSRDNVGRWLNQLAC